MSDYTKYTNTEMQAVAIARELRNDQIVIVGTGLPIIGAIIAKRVYAPDCILIVESGHMDCNPLESPRSVAENRMAAQCAVHTSNVTFVGFETNELLHDSNRLVAFIGGAQVSPYGDVNSTVIGDYHAPKMRMTGSGGANGIATQCNTILMIQHERRRFMEQVDYITSPGYLGGPDGRAKAGLPTNRGPQMVVSDRGVMKFDEKTKRMYLHGYYETSSPEDIIANTGFEIDVSRAVKIDPPTPDIIKLIREEIDPKQIFIKVTA
jgi:glutaconate CoA-transferase subunit B